MLMSGSFHLCVNYPTCVGEIISLLKFLNFRSSVLFCLMVEVRDPIVGIMCWYLSGSQYSQSPKWETRQNWRKEYMNWEGEVYGAIHSIPLSPLDHLLEEEPPQFGTKAVEHEQGCGYHLCNQKCACTCTWCECDNRKLNVKSFRQSIHLFYIFLFLSWQ